MRFVGFYTKDTLYRQEAEQLVGHLDKYNLTYSIFEIESDITWVRNCAKKPSIIKHALDKFTEDIFYIDVDARFLREPPIEELNSTVPMLANWITPFRGKQFEILSGSIFFPNNDLSNRIVTEWQNLQNSKVNVWDQKVLQLVIEQNKYEYESLPLKWCWIKEYMKDVEDPIIWHTQASRRLRKTIK